MCPLMELFHWWCAFSNVLQILERDVLTVVIQCFAEDLVRNLMEFVPNVSRFSSAHLLHRSMRGLSPSLLEITTNPFELLMSVSKFSAGREVGRRGSSDVNYSEVNPENCPVRGVVLYFGFRFRLWFAET